MAKEGWMTLPFSSRKHTKHNQNYIGACTLHIYMYIAYLHVHVHRISTCTCTLHIYMYIAYLHMYIAYLHVHVQYKSKKFTFRICSTTVV